MSVQLFKPVTLGSLELPNRIIMAPLTRCRASEGRIPNGLMAEYYSQRASAGMIISEATSISPTAVGYPDTPGIWSEEQVDGWKKVTQSVHDAGGRILLQLWHVGRMSDPMYLNGESPVAPSAIPPEGHVSLVRPKKAFEIPRALETHEIHSLIEDYRKAAENAKRAGFDGVELHAANGYLIDQFLQDSTNVRTDEYGGSIENRSRLLLEVIDTILEVWEPGRVGIHLAPKCDIHSMGDSAPEDLFLYVAEKLGERNLAFLCARESHDGSELGPEMAQRFGGALIANQGFDLKSAESALIENRADAVAFGQLYIANPDLMERFSTNTEPDSPNADTFYEYDEGRPDRGYTDYSTAAPTSNCGKKKRLAGLAAKTLAILMLGPGNIDTQAETSRDFPVVQELTWSNYSVSKLPISEQTKTLAELDVKSIWVTVSPNTIQKLEKFRATPEVQSGALSIDIVRVNFSAKWQYNRQALEPLFEQVKELGLPLWVYVTGKADQRPQAVALFEKICKDAQDYDLDVVIYPHASQIFRNAMESLELINEIGADNLKLSVMWCHEVKSGDYTNIDNVMDKVAPYLKIASINGADEQISNQPNSGWRFAIMPLDEGDIDPKPFIEALAKHGYSGPVLHKCWGIRQLAEEYIPRSNQRWKELTKNP